MGDYYKLVDKRPVPCNLEEWAYQPARTRQVGRTQLPNGGLVSTVFLSIDHNWDEGEPILFESMYFPNGSVGHEEDCVRYCTWEEAYEGHRVMVEKYGGVVSPKDMFDDDLFVI